MISEKYRFDTVCKQYRYKEKETKTQTETKTREKEKEKDARQKTRDTRPALASVVLSHRFGGLS